MRREVLGRPLAVADRAPADERLDVELAEQGRDLGVLLLEQTNGFLARDHARILTAG